MVTFLLVAANLLVFWLGPSCQAFGFVPAQFMRSGDVSPILTSMFLHDPSGWLHIGGNVAFLAVFGLVVEREIGSLRFSALYLVAGVAGALMHVVVDPSSSVPLVGASGAIFGVIAVAGAIRPRFLGFALAFGAVEVWHAFTGGDAGVAFGCHIGGLVAGSLFAVVVREGRALEVA